MNNIISVSIIAMISILYITHVDGTSETKPAYAQAFCGDDFVKAWKTVCKYKDQRGKRRTGRSVSENEDPSTLVRSFLPAKEAKQFLHPLHRKRRQLAQDDATEECCYEKCTFGEIAEYAC